MRKRKLKISLHRIRKTKITDGFTHQGVPQGRKKLYCGTPFLWCEICLILAFVAVYPLLICVQNLVGTVPLLEGDSAWVYCFMEGCFESMESGFIDLY